MLAVPPRHEIRRAPLRTARLVLTPVDAGDAAELWVATDSSRNELEPWLAWVPFNVDADASYRYAEASAADWDHVRACRFTMRERLTGRVVGVIGLEAFAHLHRSAELGYWLRTDATGNGYMTEAGQVVLDWAFGPLDAHRIRIAAATDNEPSLRVIARLDFRYEGIARQAERCAGRWLDHRVFSLLTTDKRNRVTK